MTGFTPAEMDELKRRQARLLRGDIDIRADSEIENAKLSNVDFVAD